MIRRMLVVWLVLTVSVLVIDELAPAFHLAHRADAVLLGAALGLTNALVWPLLVRVALPLTVLTLGLGAFVLNAAVVLTVLRAVPGVRVGTLSDAFVASLLISFVSSVLSGLLDLDDDELFQRRAARRSRRHRGEAATVPGLLCVQVDGLGYDVLLRAIRDGDVPHLARWVRTGSHRLVPWETDWTSQTSASQCAILHGDNDDIPAFRWLEKDTGRLVVSNTRSDAAEIERRHSDGKGLLHADGASRGNLFTGDAEHAVMTMSVAGRRDGGIGRGYYGYFANPNNAARTLFATVAEIARELAASAEQRRLDVRPRVSRGGVYPFLRAFTSVISRDVIVSAVLDDLMAGRSVIYADLLGYDEVSHHSGIENRDALGVLRGIDRQIGRLAHAALLAPRPYELVVLSDHGQSQGEPFGSRWGEDLEDVVLAACGRGDLQAGRERVGAESRPRSRAAEAWQADAVLADLRRSAPRERARYDSRRSGELAASRGEPVVLASGCLGAVYLTARRHRLTLEEVDELAPDLVRSLRDHPGIGFVFAVSEADGPVVLGQHGKHVLRTGEVDGIDPLLPFGPHAARRALRMADHAHAGDLVVNSTVDPATGEVAAFESLLGSHGGMGGPQTRAFLLHPASVDPGGPVFGADQVHRVLRGWLRDWGHEAFQD